MYKKIFLSTLILLVSGCLVYALAIAAQPTQAEKFKHADRNKDGVVDKKEMHMEKDWKKQQRSKVNTGWEKKADTNKDGIVDSNELVNWKSSIQVRSQVNTAVEKRYDTNSDGWIDATEAKELLKDKYTIIKTHGKAKVDTQIEAQYDTNGDGVIDANEAEAFKDAIK